jgi:para-aminobenzoate synthetase component 1
MHIERLHGSESASAEAWARALGRRPGLVWLDGDGRTDAGRWSYVASDPVRVVRVPLDAEAPLDVLDAIDRDDGMRGGGATGTSGTCADPTLEAVGRRAPHYVGYLAYDAGWAVQSRALGSGGGPGVAARPGTATGTGKSTDAPRVEAMWLGRYDAVLAFDAGRSEAFLVGDDAEACARLWDRVQRGMRSPASGEAGLPLGFRTGVLEVPPRGAHEDAVRAALAYIGAGDCYLLNLARRWRAEFEGDALALYLAMRARSPVPLGAFVHAGDHAVAACTMERFLAWERGTGGRLSTRPIKGTVARRGDDAGEARTLRDDAKERAEHAMIVDLMRNDLGRVAEVGSVRVDEPFRVEPYAALSHLVSTVSCRTRPGVTLREVLEATFPPGSVTGTPKRRAMERIAELEPAPRGVYCGAVGYVARDGGLSLAVAIRTAVVGLPPGATREVVVYHAGGGIVSASDPVRETDETELKARVFLEALASVTHHSRFATAPPRWSRSGNPGRAE